MSTRQRRASGALTTKPVGTSCSYASEPPSRPPTQSRRASGAAWSVRRIAGRRECRPPSRARPRRSTLRMRRLWWWFRPPSAGAGGIRTLKLVLKGEAGTAGEWSRVLERKPALQSDALPEGHERHD